MTGETAGRAGGAGLDRTVPSKHQTPASAQNGPPDGTGRSWTTAGPRRRGRSRPLAAAAGESPGILTYLWLHPAGVSEDQLAGEVLGEVQLRQVKSLPTPTSTTWVRTSAPPTRHLGGLAAGSACREHAGIRRT